MIDCLRFRVFLSKIVIHIGNYVLDGLVSINYQTAAKIFFIPFIKSRKTSISIEKDLICFFEQSSNKTRIFITEKYIFQRMFSLSKSILKIFTL